VSEPVVGSRAVVGLFVLVTLGILAWGTLQLGGYGFKRAEGYPLFATVDSAYGVEPQSPVLIAGIKVGEVTAIDLVQKRARITMKMLKGTQIHKDAKVLIKTSGLLGEKYLDVDPGSDDKPLLLPGDEIRDASSPPDFEQLMSKMSEIAIDIKEITASLRYAMGSPESRESLRNTLLNLERITRQVDAALAENRAGVRDIVASVQRLTAKLETTGPGVIDNFNQVASDMRGFMASASDAVADVRPRLDKGFDEIESVVAKLDDAARDIRDITAKINRGEGTVGKLLNDPQTAQKLDSTLDGVNKLIKQVSDLKTTVRYRGEYRFNETNRYRLVENSANARGGMKNYVGLMIQPKQDKYYLFEIVQDPAGKVSRQKTIIRDAKGKIVNSYYTQKIEDRIEFSAEIAKSIYGVTLRGGLIENTGGFGLDYAIIDPGLSVSVQAFDFTNPNNPNLKAELDWAFYRHFFVTAGAEEILNNQLDPLYFGGAGIQFDDDDLKILLSTLPKP
jgi:phospholipid/cholesterol/gamma-HCH transport system substrate-binding protein